MLLLVRSLSSDRDEKPVWHLAATNRDPGRRPPASKSKRAGPITGDATHQVQFIWVVWVTLADASNGVPLLRFYFSVTALSKNRNPKKMFATGRSTTRRME
jgi:hypothetical protein